MISVLLFVCGIILDVVVNKNKVLFEMNRNQINILRKEKENEKNN